MIDDSRFTANELFDFLYSQKDDIEQSLGKPVKWENGDNTKYSRISLGMEGVSIAKEDDWEKMSDFHATWSRRFHDVFVPIDHNFIAKKA